MDVLNRRPYMPFPMRTSYVNLPCSSFCFFGIGDLDEILDRTEEDDDNGYVVGGAVVLGQRDQVLAHQREVFCKGRGENTDVEMQERFR